MPYSVIDLIQGKPGRDSEEQKERIRQMRQENELGELGLEKRRKEAAAGLDDKELQKKGLDLDYQIETQKFMKLSQPDQQEIAGEELAQAKMDSRFRTLAGIYTAFELGDKKGALKRASDSNAIAPGVKFSDMHTEDGEEKDAKGKPVRMFVFTPEGEGAKPIRLPVASFKRIQQRFGAKYQVVEGNLMRIGADGQGEKLCTAPHTSVNPETGGFYDQRQQPPASAGTGVVSPRRTAAQETHVDNRVKQLDSEFRYFLTGSNTFANMDEATQARYDRLMAIAGPKVRAGMAPEQARTEAIDEDARVKKLAQGAPRRAGGAINPSLGTGLTYQGPAPWRQ